MDSQLMMSRNEYEIDVLSYLRSSVSHNDRKSTLSEKEKKTQAAEKMHFDLIKPAHPINVKLNRNEDQNARSLRQDSFPFW